MKNNKGISLTEVLVTLVVLSIISSIAVVNYGSTEDPVHKRELLQSAKLFSMSVKNCILNYSSMGGWKVMQWQDSDTTEPTKEMFPCKVHSDNANPPQNRIKGKLKEKLGWDCPGDKCLGVSDDVFFCVDIQKTVKGTKYQCIVHFDIKNQKDKIFCGTPASYTDLTLTSCQADPPSFTGLRESDQVKWPDAPASSTPPPSGDPNNSG